MEETVYVVCMGDFSGQEICSYVAQIVMHSKTDATMETNASRAQLMTLLEEVWKNVSSNCALDAVQ